VSHWPISAAGYMHVREKFRNVIIYTYMEWTRDLERDFHASKIEVVFRLQFPRLVRILKNIR